jgi:PAS domain S-box-containing protein
MSDQPYTDQQLQQALTYIEIFDKAGEIDCGGCGYKTCREFAAAMLDGIARPTMCVELSKKIIEKLKKRDRELRESLFFQQELLDSIAVPIFHEDRTGLMTGCNRAFEEFVGKKLSAIKGKGIDKSIEDKDFDKINAQINQSLIRSGGRQIVETRFARPGVAEQVVELHKAALTDRAGEITGFVCAIFDITERVRRSEELLLARETAELSVSLLQKVPSGFVIVDEKLKIREANRAFAMLMGEEIVELFDAHGLRGADLKSLFPSHQLFATFIQSGEDNYSRDVEWSGRKIKLALYAIERGKTAGAILLDLTAPDVKKEEVRQRAEKVIRENLETVQKIANLLGENASRTENALSSVIKLFSEDEK